MQVKICNVPILSIIVCEMKLEWEMKMAKREFYQDWVNAPAQRGDSKSWEYADEADIVWRLFIQMLFR